jgi:glycosyltransferase involved in cell wall biosynthesis
MGRIKVLPQAISDAETMKHASLPHVLLVVDQFPKSLGGGERIVLRLAALLPRYGYRVSILTFFIHPESSVLSAPSPCPIYTLPLQRTYDLTALRAAFELKSFLREQKIQIVQTFFESSDIWAGFVVKTLSRARLVWSRRDMGILRSRKHSLSYRLMAGVPDRVFAVSEQVRRHCIEVDRVDAGRVETIYNGLDLVDSPVAEMSGRAPGEFLVTTVGNVRHVKGHDLFIRAAAVVAQRFPRASFSIAGEVLEPKYFAELQSLVDELKLSEKVHFVGGVTKVREHLSRADIFVLPSRSEGFSNAIIEAMAESLPVVATDVGGNAEAVLDGVSGFIVPPEDAGALAEAISQLLGDRSRATKMGAAGKLRVAEQFTTDAMMKRIETAYANLLALS